MTDICVITPITTKDFRDDAQLNGATPDNCNVTTITLERGPASVESAVDEVLAAPGVVDAACRAQADGFDAIVIDCMLDPALEAAREAVTIPVVGSGEAGLKAAAEFGDYSVVTVLQRQEAAFQRLARQYGTHEKLRSVHGIGVSVLDLERARDSSIEATIRGAKVVRDRDGAKAIVFGCTGMLGYADPTAKALGWPANRVIDPLVNAIETAFLAANAGEKTDKNDHPYPDRKRVVGFEKWSALCELVSAR
ncbi:MAG: aspartate/glutamate racemase family protein [Stappiaceae bacterium]